MQFQIIKLTMDMIESEWEAGIPVTNCNDSYKHRWGPIAEYAEALTRCEFPDMNAHHFKLALAWWALNKLKACY